MHYDIIMNVYECQVLKVHEIHEMLNLSNPDTAVIFTTRWSIGRATRLETFSGRLNHALAGKGSGISGGPGGFKI